MPSFEEMALINIYLNNLIIPRSRRAGEKAVIYRKDCVFCRHALMRER